MAVTGKLKTADNLISRGIVVPSLCTFCSRFPENHNHLFFGCDFSFMILIRMLPELNIFLLRPTIAQIYDFFEHSSTYNRREKDFGCLSISCIIYYIWKERNCRRFSGVCINSVKVICTISNAIRLKTAKWKTKDMLLERFSGI
ncbi:hypothetical protein MA16_Dca008234 [Dendrobium catenatum]|uniref:Reverse transcriptase zinc-binding domain-containing protein n=1 Tax=Dendrobium catenatum TaxID=906689 RepID=A0A2I0X6K9_9ASPA|nr:hypothetical protein MA16_Dca008234 [Dendrobium catenatum]